MSSGPLEGFKILDLSSVVSGPMACVMLADQGADVIKVEKPSGDDSRRFVPPKIGHEAAAYMMMNRNKRGIAIDLKSVEGQAVLKDLIKDADILLSLIHI